MKRINEFLVILIFILTAVLVAAVGFKAYDVYDTNRRLAREQEEMELAEVFARNQEAQNRIREMRAEIQELTEDKQELQLFIARIQNEELAVQAYNTYGTYGVVSGNMTVSGNGTVSGNTAGSRINKVSGNAADSTISMVSGNGIVSGNTMVSGNAAGSKIGMVSGNGTVSENSTVSGNDTISGNDIMPDAWSDSMTLSERRLLRTSMEETLEVNRADREKITGNHFDFSGMKIACLGDSITAAINLENEEDYQQYSYPSKLKELLGAEEVYNLGIGGSSIGRYWADAYVDRYQEIPEDVDIIIVMGGTNDGFCVSDKEFGNLEERAYRTFCGDLDELMRGLRENYPDAEVFIATPLPNVLHDYLMSERDYLLPQQNFVDVMLTLADEYDYEVIDLYNSNILDSHDAGIVAEYMPDGVHGNKAGYQILAEHFAAELIRYYEADKFEAVSENTVKTDD